MQQIDFKAIQGAGETRIAAAAGVPPVIVGVRGARRVGAQRRQLRAGAARVRRPDHAPAVARLRRAERLLTPPAGAQLWYDDRDIAFLREDEKDVAEILSCRSSTIESLFDAGYTPETWSTR